MLAFDLVVRWMHIVGAIMLVGSTIYMRCIYVPAKDFAESKPSDEFNEWIRKLWARMVMISSGQLLVSGLVAFMLIMSRYEISDEGFPGNAYQPMFGIKFLLALVIFFLAAAVSGKSSLAQRMRKREKFWLTINMTLAIILVCLAGVMRQAKRSEKSTSSLPQPATTALIADAVPFAGPVGRIG
jgi:hypothetical protein